MKLFGVFSFFFVFFLKGTHLPLALRLTVPLTSERPHCQLGLGSSSARITNHNLPHWQVVLIDQQAGVLLPAYRQRQKKSPSAARGKIWTERPSTSPLTRRADRHRSCNSVWGWCSCAQFRMRTSVSPDRNLPNRNASRWLVPTTR